MSAPTFHGVSTNPADAGSLIEPQTAIALTPPASMLEGDLVVVFMYNENGAAGDGLAINGTGGQTWTSDTTSGSYSYSGAAAGHRIYWCRFNGTWTADPTFNFPDLAGNRGCGMQMLVFRPDATTKTWAKDVGPNWAGFSAPSTPFTVTITGVSPTKSDTVTIARWCSDDDNTWGSLSGTGWSNTGLTAQYRNTGGSDLSTTYAYNLKGAASATNDVSQNQATLGGDAGSTVIVTFYAAAAAYTVTAEPGSFNLTGSDATLLYKKNVSADAGSYAFTGSDASLELNRIVTASAGSYSLTGSDVGLYFVRTISAGEGSFSLTGNDATLTLSGAGSRAIVSWLEIVLAKSSSQLMTADPGSYNLTGSDASLLHTRIVVADAGSYALTGSDASLELNRIVTASEGSYSLTGSDASLELNRVITASAGDYALTGSDAGLYLARVVTAGEGAYALTGSDANLVYTPLVVVETAVQRGGSSKRRKRPRPRYWWEEEEEQETVLTPEVIAELPPVIEPSIEMPRIRFPAEPERPQVNLAPMMRAMRKRAKMKLAAMIAMDMLDE